MIHQVVAGGKQGLVGGQLPQGGPCGRHQLGLRCQVTPGLQQGGSRLGAAPKQAGEQSQELRAEHLRGRPVREAGFLLQQREDQGIGDRQRFQLGSRRHLLTGGSPQQGDQPNKASRTKLLGGAEHSAIPNQQAG